MSLSIKEKYLFFIICSAGILLRYYNFSFDDLWYDEVISFWVADPSLKFQETIKFNQLIDINTSIFHFILKFFFSIFGYSVENGRLLSVIFSSLSIFTVTYLSWMISQNKSFLLTSFLISFNIYLISFSQEVRVYSLLFFSASIYLIFFLKVLESQKNYLALSMYFLSSILLISLHPFALIIFFSCIIYLFSKSLKHNKKYFLLNLANLITLAIAIYIYYSSFFLISDSENNNEFFWMTNPDIGFYSNFYFSSFFGSRLMGALFLITLIALVTKNFKKIFYLSPITLFLLIIFLSYFLPVLFGYIFKPILVNRYIIFILIPIIIIISTLIYYIKNPIIKKTVFSILILFTIGNHFTEQTFKQFFKKRVYSKPQYTAALTYINNSGHKNYFLKAKKMKNKNATIDAVNHYINYLNTKNKLSVKFARINERGNLKFLWHLCFQDFNGKDCTIDDFKNQYKIIKKENFNNIELKLLEII